MGNLRGALPVLNPNPNLNPFCVGSERWARAENLTRDIIRNVQPTTVSEQRRKALIDYVQRLIRGSLHCEVFPYGSVPLKTFLPDGDIDLTTFGGPALEDGLVNDMVHVLERENHNKNAEFTIEDVQLISAEVKIVKCLVEKIVVDISFNQIGGLCSLCFLEKVDDFIGRDHLFKRSIILIKAWCYYESRILGAHHGLISTYALETLILYIFHLFHSSLDGPLAVLYKFLDYFSKFDWEKYCISLSGPVRLSSLPEIVAEEPENDEGGFLLSNDFIRDCVSKFSVPSRGIESNSRVFQQKHLNIVDPLKENNNLGRSVSKGNFYRIRSAFTYGARKLGRILSQSEDNIADGLNGFFSNTLSRHRNALSLDVKDLSPTLVDSIGDSKAVVNGSSDKEEHNRNGCLEAPQSTLHSEAVDPRDATESSSSVKQSPKLSNGSSTKPIFAPHLFFTNSARNAETKKENLDMKHSERDGDNVSSESRKKGSKQHCIDHDRPSTSGLSDLSGDYDYHFNCLQFGRRCFEHLSLVSPFHAIKYLPETVLFPLQLQRNGFSRGSPNGFGPGQAVFYSPNPMVVPGVAFGFDEMPKPRGTGTYFPNTNRPNGYRHPKGRNRSSSCSPRTNDRKATFADMHETARSAIDRGEVNRSSSPRDKGHSKPNGHVFDSAELIRTRPIDRPLPDV